MTESTAVVKKESLVPALADELLAQFGQFAGAGTENMTAADKAIPFIQLVQSLSPQRKKDNPRYIDGAEEGDIFNSVTLELFKRPDGALVIPVDFTKVYNKWIPRKEGGGFLGSYKDAECKQPVNPGAKQREYDGEPQIVQTANHFVLIQSADGSWQQALLSMKSTQLKVSRRWSSKMSMLYIPTGPDGAKVPAPTFARAYRLKSTPDKNDKGDFFNYTIDDAGWIPGDAFPLAADFSKSLAAGRVKVDYTKEADDGDLGGEEEADEKLPF